MKDINRRGSSKSNGPVHNQNTSTVQKKGGPTPGSLAKDSLVQRSINDQARSSSSASSSLDTQTKMPSGVQAKMENSFGADFSNVNIHQGDSATQMNALAYTQGNNIHFAPGQYNPDSKSGQELLGHELTHVVQQRNGNVAPTTQFKGVGLNDNIGLETEADKAGKLASEGKMANVKGHQSNQIQFKPEGNNSGAGAIDRTLFNKSVSEYCDSLRILSNKQLEWFDNNIHDYVASTFTAPANNFTSDMLGKMIKQSTQETFDQVLFESIKKGGEKYLTKKVIKALAREGSAIGAGVATGAVTQAIIPVPVVGFAVGFIVAVLVDIASGILVDYFFDNESNLAAIQGAAQANELYKPYGEQINQKRNARLGEIGSMYDIPIHNAGDGISNQDLLNQYANEINSEKQKIESQIAKINLGDRTLFKKMLAEWLLSNVGDTNDSVNPYGATQEQFEANIKTMNDLTRKDGYKFSNSNTKITDHATTFAYQTRAELLRLGVNEAKANQICESYKKTVYDFYEDQSWDQYGNIHTNYREQQAYRKYNNQTISISGNDISDIKKFKEQIKGTNDLGWFNDEEEKAVDAKNFTLSLRHGLKLNLKEGMVTVESFYYKLKTADNSTTWSENL